MHIIQERQVRDTLGKYQIRNVVFGDRIPKICVPIVGRSREEIMAQSAAIIEESDRIAALGLREAPVADMIEFRADYFDHVTNQTELTELLKDLRAAHPDRLLLFTYRSEEEGGELRHDRAENMIDDISSWAMVSGCIDLIDIELMSGNYRVVRNATKARDLGIGVVMSFHDFEITPHNEDMESHLWDMEQLGGDILKIAVTPRNHFDVDRVLELTEAVTRGHSNHPISRPVVLISMTNAGTITRTACAKTGSAFTFANVGMGSAPGQLTLEEMVKQL